MLIDRIVLVGKTKGRKKPTTKVEYLNQLKGYDPFHNSWEPEDDLNEAASQRYYTS